MRCRRFIGLSASACLAAALANAALAANNPPAFDPRDALGEAATSPRLGIDPVTPSLVTSSPDPAEVSIPTNPLWAIPIAALRATRERPIFLPSRRPLVPPAVATDPRGEEPTKPFVAALEPEPPPLNLVGVASGIAGGFAVFIDVSTRDIVRLRTGESHGGWVLRAVQGREAVLEKDERSAVIGLPAPVGESK